MGRKGFTKTQIKKMKAAILEIIEKCGNFTLAAQKLGITCRTIRRWRKEDMSFKLAVRESQEIKWESIGDMAESTLVKNIRNGDQKAAEFALKRIKRFPQEQPRIKAQKLPPDDNPIQKLLKAVGNIEIDTEGYD